MEHFIFLASVAINKAREIAVAALVIATFIAAGLFIALSALSFLTRTFS